MSPTNGSPQVSSDREKWKHIFSALVRTFQTLQSQLDTLLEERKGLELRFKTQYEYCVSDARSFEDQISQMKRELSLAEFARLVEASKSDLMLGFKNREAFTNKIKLEHAEDELADFKAWFDLLSHRCPDQEDKSPGELYKMLKDKGGGEGGYLKITDSENSECHNQILEDEVKRLKREYEKLSIKTSSEISVLESENSFVWNQYKKMESDLSQQLKTMTEEARQSDEKIVKLLANLEELQSANKEKDDRITSMEADIGKKNEEISRLSKEVEMLKGLKMSHHVTPVLRRCTAERKASTSDPSKTNQLMRNTVLKTESGSKRIVKFNAADAMVIRETPKLFSSSFKIPKLKNSSPRMAR